MAPAIAGAVLFWSRPSAAGAASGSSPGGAMPRVNNPGRLFWVSSFNALRVPSNPGPEGQCRACGAW
jgi:hypothetical protein